MNIHQKLEEITKKHLAVQTMDRNQRFIVTTNQIEKAIKEAYLMGEKLGYKHGFNDAKQACECSLNIN